MIAHEPSCYLHVLLTLPKQMSMLHWLAIAVAKASMHHDLAIQMEVASLRPDLLPTLTAAKTFVHSLLVKSPFWWRCGPCRQWYSDFLLQCAGDIEADHTISGIVIECAYRIREIPHLGDWWYELATTTTTTHLCLLNDGVVDTSRKISILSVWIKWHLLVKFARRNIKYKEVQQH